jgi:(p)ppGpp synthase/HD superfamily hydrolase
VASRIKTPYWVYRKMQKRQCSWNDVRDRLAIRVLCADESACYRVLGYAHRLFHPVPGSLKDYIAHPKANGYRSLHAVVIVRSPTARMVEIQIRSEDMHWTDEFGSASHVKYKMNEFEEAK